MHKVTNNQIVTKKCFALNVARDKRYLIHVLK